MGDRCNIVIAGNGLSDKSTLPRALVNSVVLYGHWSGDSFVNTVRQALAKKWRWNDHGYLSRIVFDEFTEGQTGKETGFGIYAGHLGDNEHDIIVIDCEEQRVRRFEEVSGLQVASWTFEDFIKSDVTW